jgi:hypothetical protein
MLGNFPWLFAQSSVIRCHSVPSKIRFSTQFGQFQHLLYIEQRVRFVGMILGFIFESVSERFRAIREAHLGLFLFPGQLGQAAVIMPYHGTPPAPGQPTKRNLFI